MAIDANAPQPALGKVTVNGVELAYFERGRRREGAPTLFFVHATGFHGRIWDYIVEQIPECHSIAFEQRGHGRSAKLAVEHWRTFGQDQAAFVTALGLDNLIGIGHSMGAHGLIDAAAQSGAFARLLLLDPTVADPASYAEDTPASLWGGGVHPASKRRNRFGSVDEMVDQLAPKSAFPLFRPRVLRDYCEHGLLRTGSGDYQLACPPLVEAHVYMAARSNGAVYDSVRALDIPVSVVRARLPDGKGGMDFSTSPTWPQLAGEFRQGRDTHLADCSHFIPMQRPDLVVRLIREEIAAWQNC